MTRFPAVMPPDSVVEQARAGLSPAQQDLIERIMLGAEPEDAIAEAGLSPTLWGRWVLNPMFMSQLLIAMDLHERTHVGAFWSFVRRAAMKGDPKMAAVYAKFALSVLPARATAAAEPAFQLSPEDVQDFQ